jgi:hypothetical protein
MSDKKFGLLFITGYVLLFVALGIFMFMITF